MAPSARGLSLLVLALALALIPGVAAAQSPPGAPRVPDARAAADREGPGSAELRREEGEAEGPSEIRREAEFFERLGGGPIDGARWRQMWNDAMALPAEARSTNVVNDWQLVGPLYSVNVGGGNMTGRVRDIDALHQRVLAASGGLWRFNFGPIAMTDSVPATWFGSFATNPYDANTILLGTGEYGQGTGTGLYKTTDGGATWVHKSMFPEPAAFMRVRYSPDGLVVHAATTSGYFRSTDGGETWNSTMAGTFTDLSTVQDNSNLVFATVANLGLWRSLDGGASWGQVTSGGIPTSGTGNGAVAAISTGSAVWIYVVFETQVWRSQNGGATWTNITPPYTVGNSGYGPTISVCPVDANTVLYGNVSCNRTTDAGAHWTTIVTPHLHADYHAFSWDDGGIGVWAGNDGGWSHSTNQGLNWDSSANVMPISQFYDVDCEKTEVGYMIGGTQDNNVLFTPNQALFWSDPDLRSTEGDAYGVCINLYDPTQMWAVSGEASGSWAYPRYRTTDGGTTWTPVTNGIDPNSYAGVIRTDNASPVHLYTSAGTWVYESTDGGTTWTKVNPVEFPYPILNLTTSTRVSPSSVLYANLVGSTVGLRLYVRDGGNWYERSSGLPAGMIQKVVPHPWAAGADEAWAIMNGAVAQKIFHTTNRGATWTNVTGDFPASIAITDLVPNPEKSGELYVGTLLGCYRSKNGGVNWERWNNGLNPAVKVTEMTYIDLTSTTGQFFVVAATYGRSVWKRDVSGEDPQPTLSINDYAVEEGDTGTRTAWFKVTLPAPQSYTVRVDYATMDSTATAGDNDYVPASGTLTFTPGQTARFLTVAVNGDTRIEPDEAFKLVLSNPINADVGSYGVATIQDDDAHALICRDQFVANGSVNTIVPSGSRLYIGGSFTRVGPASGGAVPLDANSGLPTWLPRVEGSVYAVAPDGSGGWFLGGLFTHVDGHPRTNLAHLYSDHTLADWNPTTDDIVLGLAVSGSTVYVAGRFTRFAGVPRHNLASIDANGGFANDWDPNPNDTPVALVVSGGTVYVGGDFTSIGGQPRNRIAALSAATGLATAWDPGADAEVATLALGGSTLYAGGSFTGIGGQPRNRLAALDTGTGLATAWNPNVNSLVFSIVLDPSNVYAGGVFDSVGGVPRSGLAAVDRASGAPTSWAPNPEADVISLALSGSTLYVAGGFVTIGGQARNNLAAVSTSSGLATAWNPDPDNVVSAIGASGGTVMAGGSFSTLGAQTRNRLAAFDRATGLLAPWNPNADGSVLALVPGAGTVYVGGSFLNVGGQARNRVAELDSLTGNATALDPDANSTVRTLLLVGSKLYMGGSFTTMGAGATVRNRGAAVNVSTGALQSWNPNANSTINSLVTDGSLIYAGGAFGTIGGQTRTGLAALATTSGAASPTWAPNPNGVVNTLLMNGSVLYVGGAFTTIAGVTRHRLAALAPSAGLVSSLNPAPNDDVRAFAVTGLNQIYVGGDFTFLGGVARDHLALVRVTDGAIAPWTPNPNGTVSALATDGSTLYAGGSFGGIGGLPRTHLACVIPSDLVDVPRAGTETDFALSLAPNPTRGRVRLEYTLPEAARVSIGVFDVQGRRVAPPIDAVQPAGRHEATWDGTGGAGAVAPGLYFVRFEAGARRAVRRVVVVR